jgi:hypothetical protein
MRACLGVARGRVDPFHFNKGTTMRGGSGRMWWLIAGVSACPGALANCSGSGGNGKGDDGAASLSGASSGASARSGSGSGGSSGASDSGGSSASVHDSGISDGGGVSDGTIADNRSPGADGGLAFTAQLATVSCTTPDKSPFPNGSQTSLSVYSGPLCSALASFAGASTDGGLDDAEIAALENLVKNTESLQFTLFSSTPAVATTTYTVSPPCGAFLQPAFSATASYTAYDANGMQSVFEQATSGTLTLAAVSATEVAGSYDVTFMTNAFVQDACNAWGTKCASAIGANKTCLADFDGGSPERITGTFTVQICAPPVCKSDGGM